MSRSHEDLRNLLDALLRRAVEVGASDIHLKVGSKPKMRINGQLYAVKSEDRLSPNDTMSMVDAIMPDHVKGRFAEVGDADFAFSDPKVGRFRVNTFRQRGSVGLVLRHVTYGVDSIAELGLPRVVQRLADEPRGLVLVTGPTGSGKTTTLAAMVDHINSTRNCHIVTIEDPIEILHRDKRASINQREIGLDSKSFATAMRAALRQDPDVILVGEMRDPETVNAALQAAETGHLVLSSMHTTDASETVNRIIEFFPHQQHRQVRATLASALRGTLGQRLVPAANGEGRVPVTEAMVVTGRVAQAIVDMEATASLADLIAEGDYYGMQTFDQGLADLVSRRLITVEAAMSAASRPHDLRVAMERAGVLDHRGNHRDDLLGHLNGVTGVS
ncbi:MAG: type IV pilus twitching motility protein PilT [Acidimicrobiales bacterium]|nr:type IV pilus twitching motility protein PilT [Acidimicrobiales bacterium]